MSGKKKQMKRRVMVVTGSRAEYGLLRPVMEAIEKNKRLELRVVVAGEHLLGPAQTWKEVAKAFRIDAKVAMQRAGDRGRVEHAAACARGMVGFAAAIKRIKPEWVVVLGDRIEAFAAASAASIGGVAVCHIHGGDRAEGIADEAMRHAITKLAHLHCAATKGSAARIVAMGERAESVHVTGSPAIDGLAKVRAISDAEAGQWKDVRTVFLMHPAGLTAERESAFVQTAMAVVDEAAPGDVLCLAPNRDPGHEVIRAHIRHRLDTPNSRVKWWWCKDGSCKLRPLRQPSQVAMNNIGDRKWFYADHLERGVFLSLLKRLAKSGCGLMVGNSSAGMIEAPAMGVRVLNVGPRQCGRERSELVRDMPEPNFEQGVSDRGLNDLLSMVLTDRVCSLYGSGQSGKRIAALLAKMDPLEASLLRKRNSY